MKYKCIMGHIFEAPKKQTINHAIRHYESSEEIAKQNPDIHQTLVLASVCPEALIIGNTQSELEQCPVCLTIEFEDITDEEAEDFLDAQAQIALAEAEENSIKGD